uniref:Transmembrane protein 74 n=1 Tax=Gadus morhua TaxID=8049 RepID=A0A8C5F5F5_GADMO
MASQELLSDKDARQYDPTNVLAWVLSALHMRRTDNSTGGLPSKDRECSASRACQGWCNSAPRTAPHIGGGGEVRLGHLAEEKVIVCCDEELETSFTYVDENVNLRLASPDSSRKGNHKATCNGDNPCGAESLPELSFEDLSFGDSFETSLDQGFVCAVTFLVTGISLVIISYVVPRGVAVDRESVSAREMERLEREGARVGAHLDRCVIAGLCLLTLGGVVLSILLMISMWKGEVYRRKALAYTKRSTKLYGSINLVARASPSQSNTHLEDVRVSGPHGNIQ